MVKLPLKTGDRRYEVTVDRVPDDEFSFLVCVEAEGGTGGSKRVRLLARVGDRWTLEVDGRIEDLLVTIREDAVGVARAGYEYEVSLLSDRERLRRHDVGDAPGEAILVRAQMPGRIIRVLKEAGERVEAGAGLAVMEAMKMQNEIRSPRSGLVLRSGVEAGGNVNAGDVLFEIGPEGLPRGS
jgi:biotin carboxyl carrier protein